jgi:hypothetical protein
MDADSDSDSSIRSSGTAIPPSLNPSDPQFERGPLAEQFLVDQTTNLMAGEKVSNLTSQRKATKD